MPSTNHIKIGSSAKLSLSKGNITVGVSGTTEYGPTSTSGFYNGVTPPVGGYTIYVEKASQGPSIHIANDDNHCITKLKKMGAPGTTIGDVLTWALTQDSILVLKSELTNSIQNASFQNVAGSNDATGFFFGGFRNDGLLDFVKVGFLANGTGVTNAPVTAVDRVNQTITISGSQFVSGQFYIFSLDTSITPTIVTSGLVLNLDAGNASSYSGTGTTWTDLSGNGNTGTLVGGTSYSSGNGGSITFAGNGSNSYVSIPNFDLGSGDFAYETWAYSTSYAPGHFFTLNGNAQQYAAIRLQMNNNSSNPGFAIYNSYDGSSWANTFDSTTTTVPLNTWVDIVVTRVSGTMKVYVNAVEKYSVSLSGSLLASSGSVLSAIGKLQQYPNDSSFHFAGNIAVARLYQNKGLNSTEVTQNFDAIKSRFGL